MFAASKAVGYFAPVLSHIVLPFGVELRQSITQITP